MPLPRKQDKFTGILRTRRFRFKISSIRSVKKHPHTKTRKTPACPTQGKNPPKNTRKILSAPLKTSIKTPQKPSQISALFHNKRRKYASRINLKKRIKEKTIQTFQWYSPSDTFHFLGKGYTSIVYINSARNVVVKHVQKYYNYNVFEREVYWLKVFNEKKFTWAPRLITSKYPYIVMEYVGTPINKNNVPKDWLLQCQQIIRDMQEVKFIHNDIKGGEVTIKDGRLFLLDYQWGSLGGDMSCGGLFNKTKKPHGIFNDLKGSIIKKIKVK
jgi:predicted Ser/Thr protein kinase